MSFQDIRRREAGRFATEMHLHVRGTSGCAQSAPEEFLPVYRDAGYSTVVVTNHYGPWSAMTTGREGRAAIDLLKASYEQTAQEGEKWGITVLPGVEISFSAHWGDFLLYGFDWEFFYEDPEIYNRLDAAAFAALAHDAGLLLFQAHPCREGHTPQAWQALDGVEVYNGQPPGEHNHNDRAYALACERSMAMLSGSDCHHTHGAARGGILTEQRIQTLPQLLDTLRTGAYDLLYDPRFLTPRE